MPAAWYPARWASPIPDGAGAEGSGQLFGRRLVLRCAPGDRRADAVEDVGRLRAGEASGAGGC